MAESKSDSVRGLRPIFYAPINILGFFFAGIFLYGISQKFHFLSLAERKVLTLLFLVLPFNTARVASMVFHYSEAYFFFFFRVVFTCHIQVTRR